MFVEPFAFAPGCTLIKLFSRKQVGLLLTFRDKCDTELEPEIRFVIRTEKAWLRLALTYSEFS